MSTKPPTTLEHLARRRFGQAIPPRVSSRLLVDVTTGLPNHLAFELFYQQQRRAGRTPAVIEADICGFGRFNERRGGLRRGNEVLARFATALRRSVKATDLVARWSIGDEFIVAIDGVTTESALEQVRQRLQGPFRVEWGRRRLLLRCYTAALLTRGRRLDVVEELLHERLRRTKVLAKAIRHLATTSRGRANSRAEEAQ